MNWQQFWQHRKIGNIALLPLSILFYTITTARRACYRYGILQSEKAPLPVVVVGNINVGGAGKTPLVIALGKLLAQNGINYAVISRGYGGSYTVPTVVNSGDTADKVGDEPLLIKLKCACPVVVAKSRIEAAKLVAKQFPDTQIILSDDGLQHYQLHRDMEICVLNDSVGLGNGWLLPAGGLRESPARLDKVDFVVHNVTSADAVKQDYHYILAERGWYHINSAKCRYHDEFCNDKNKNLAISGIAHPALFFQRLSTLGIYAKMHPLPDHHAINANDLPANKTVLMTEKDWVKAKAFRHDDAWFLAVEAILSQPLQHDFLQKAMSLIEKKPD